MKQAMALALAAAMALSLAGCGEPASASQSVSQPASVSQPESASQPASASQPESAPVSVPAPTGESYFDANGIPVLDEPSDLEVHAVAYDMEDSTIQRTVPAQVSARVVVGDAEKEGYKKVALYVTVTCSDFAYNEEGGLDEDVAYNSGIYDLYTGRALPTRSTTDDTTYDYTTTVEEETAAPPPR